MARSQTVSANFVHSNSAPAISETISVTGFGLLDLDHGYFAEAESVILDLCEAIESRRHAAEREAPRAEEGHFVIDQRQ